MNELKEITMMDVPYDALQNDGAALPQDSIRLGYARGWNAAVAEIARIGRRAARQWAVGEEAYLGAMKVRVMKRGDVSGLLHVRDVDDEGGIWLTVTDDQLSMDPTAATRRNVAEFASQQPTAGEPWQPCMGPLRITLDLVAEPPTATFLAREERGRIVAAFDAAAAEVEKQAVARGVKLARIGNVIDTLRLALGHNPVVSEVLTGIEAIVRSEEV